MENHRLRTLQERQRFCLGYAQHGPSDLEAPQAQEEPGAGFTSCKKELPPLEIGLTVLRAPRPLKVYLNYQIAR